MRSAFVAITLAICLFFYASDARAACISVDYDPGLAIRADNLQVLDKMKVGTPQLFKILKNTSLLESGGCWGGISDNFDGQTLSAGILQWNYGSHSLQPLLKRFALQTGSAAALADFIKNNMPSYGTAIFSAGCLASKITEQCKAQILDGSGNPLGGVRAEFEVLFNSALMRQIQLDFVLTDFTQARDNILALSGKEQFSARKVAWAFDMVVQQGHLPNADNVARVRAAFARRDPEKKKETLQNILAWYVASCRAIDQDGCWRDYEYNVGVWTGMINAGLSDDQADLILMTYLRSRSATGEEGRWQALSFQRRAAIVFGKGKLAQREVSFDYEGDL